MVRHTVGAGNVAWMERLSGLDAGLLYSESSAVPLHVCSVAELDTSTVPGGYTFQRFCSGLSSRMSALPELRAKLADSQLNLDHPVWVEDRDFQLSRHLHRIGVPSPGGREELADVCADIVAIPLDRSKPLWEMWVIEGLGGNADQCGPDRVALLVKVHHAAVDGVAAADLLGRLCDVEPDAAPRDPVAGSGDATSWAIAADGLLRFLTRPWQLTKVIPEAASTIVETVGRAVSGTAMAAPFTAPETPFNAKLTSARNIAVAQLDLECVKQIKNHCGVKVNDVVMALVSGVLRAFLSQRGELPDASLVAMVPVSVHDKSDRPGRNQVSGMFSRLETGIEDPAERIAAIAEANSVAKQHSSAISATLLQDWTQFAAPAVFGTAMRVYASSRLSGARPVHNLVVSNVPGPQEELFMLGCRVAAMYPLGPIFHGSGLNMTVMSLSGNLDVGIVSCPELVPDLWDMADAFESALKELLSAVK